MFFTEVHTKKGGSFKNRLVKDYSRNQKNFFFPMASLRKPPFGSFILKHEVNEILWGTSQKNQWEHSECDNANV